MLVEIRPVLISAWASSHKNKGDKGGETVTQAPYHPLTPLSALSHPHPLQRDTYADTVKVFRNLLYQVRRGKRNTPPSPHRLLF